MDSTFKASRKALLTDANQQKSKELKGGILSIINEENEIVAWVSDHILLTVASTDSNASSTLQQRFCQTRTNAEITELLDSLKRRHDALRVPPPEMMIADNCCQVQKAVSTVFPGTQIGLDVWHFVVRYVP